VKLKQIEFIYLVWAVPVPPLNVTGENVPGDEESRLNEVKRTSSEDEAAEEEEEDEWANYWPPSDSDSDKDEESEETESPEMEQTRSILKLKPAQTNSTDCMTLSTDMAQGTARKTLITEEASSRTVQGCGPNILYPGQTELLKADEAHIIQRSTFQVYVRRGKEVGAFEVHDLNGLWNCIKQRWGDVERECRLTPNLMHRETELATS
jgi:hypothetical protein